jgi:hypothetical protein
MQMLGYPAVLQVEDVEWLLEDGLKKGEHDRRLAMNSALAIQRSAGAPTALLEKIAAAANTDAVALEAYENWMRPRQPSVQEIEMDRELKEIEAQNASERAKQDQNWIDWIREIKTDPARIAGLMTTPVSGVNPLASKLAV